jgi:hypothetical protein
MRYSIKQKPLSPREMTGSTYQVHTLQDITYFPKPLKLDRQPPANEENRQLILSYKITTQNVF